MVPGSGYGKPIAVPERSGDIEALKRKGELPGVNSHMLSIPQVSGGTRPFG